MRSIKKNSNKKKLFIPIIVGIVAIGGYMAYAATTGLPPFPTREADDSNINYQPPTDEQKDSGDDISADAKTNPDPSLPEKSVDEGDGEAPAPSQSVGMEITAANQNGGQLQVRTLIQTVNSGTCNLTLSRAGSQNITRTAKNQPLSNTSTCKGFDIDVTGLAKGTWQLHIDFVSESKKGSTSRSVSIE